MNFQIELLSDGNIYVNNVPFDMAMFAKIIHSKTGYEVTAENKTATQAFHFRVSSYGIFYPFEIDSRKLFQWNKDSSNGKDESRSNLHNIIESITDWLETIIKHSYTLNV